MGEKGAASNCREKREDAGGGGNAGQTKTK